MSLVQFRPEAPPADLAHLVERNLAKVEVAGSIPVIRSKNMGTINVPIIIRRHGQAVRQRSATPLSPVRFRVAPPKRKVALAAFLFCSLLFSLFILLSSLIVRDFLNVEL